MTILISSLLLAAFVTSVSCLALAQPYPTPTVQTLTVLGSLTASGLSTSGGIAGSICETSTGIFLYEVVA